MFGRQTTQPIPVYMINGFLESGKSSFYIYTIGQPYFQTEGKTLLILCEDGEVEYSDKLLKETTRFWSGLRMRRISHRPSSRT